MEEKRPVEMTDEEIRRLYWILKEDEWQQKRRRRRLGAGVCVILIILVVIYCILTGWEIL